MEMWLNFLLLLIELTFGLAVPINYVVNGGFELPVLPPASFLVDSATGWNGSMFDLTNLYQTLGHGQYIDMQQDIWQNGYIEQTIYLYTGGNCTLSFLQQANSTFYASYVMEVYWNNQLVSTQIANTTNTTSHTFSITGVSGNNIIQFKQIGDSSDSSGMFIDQVAVICDLPSSTESNIKASQPLQLSLLLPILILTIENITAIIFSTSFNQIRGIRCIYLFALDLILYNYDKVIHEGLLSQVLNQTMEIERLKFNFFQEVLHWQKFSSYIQISDYLPYTSDKFIQVQNSSSVLLQAAFSFFVYTVPENILLCLLLYCLFLISHKYKVSQFVRKFYFIKIVLLQTFIEGNVAYFSYVCFGHLSTPFTFQFGDKLSLIFTTCVLWIVIMFCFAFYPLVGYFLQKKAGYFLSYAYRCNPGYLSLSLKNLIRNFLRGSVFYFFHQFFTTQVTLLIIIQILILLIFVSYLSGKKAFLSKTFYSLSLAYHFQFILFNLTFYFEHEDILKPLVFDIQQFWIYMLVGNVILMILYDIMPLSWLRTNKDKNQETDTKQFVAKNQKQSSSLRKLDSMQHSQNNQKQKQNQQCKSLLKIESFDQNELKPKQLQKLRMQRQSEPQIFGFYTGRWRGVVTISKKSKGKTCNRKK